MDQYTVNEEDYRSKKRQALMSKSRATRSEVYKMQRDILLWLIYKKLNKNQVQISKLCKAAGFKIERNTISEIIMEREKLLMQQEEDKDKL